ncbi:CACNA1H [Symbiodinium natans]|uniref:CACNA1H protein n=1 Tax=Symbiodinium natans TaxID=878477 RepID=A0A812L076_9DINO|nr:CACNA1H [Symbiodinium natans]
MPVPTTKPATFSFAQRSRLTPEESKVDVDAAACTNADGDVVEEVQLIQRFEEMLSRRDVELFRRLDKAIHGFGAIPAETTVSLLQPQTSFKDYGNGASAGASESRMASRSKALVESRVRMLAAQTKRELELDIFSDPEDNVELETSEPQPSPGRNRRRSTRTHSRFSRWQHYLLKHVIGNFWFEGFLMVGILTHSFILGVQIDLATVDSSDQDIGFILDWIQHAFAFIFAVELALRWMAEGQSFLWRSSNVVWNWLDTFLVLTSVVEVVGELSVAWAGDRTTDLSLIGNMRVIRIVRISRLLRVLRIVRVVRFVRSLRNLVSSIAMTFRSLAWSVMLLVIIIYMFGVLLTDGVSDFLRNGEGIDLKTEIDLKIYFGSVHDAMHTLFRSIANGISWDVVIRPLIQASWFWGYVYSLYVVFTLFAVLNVITAVFCQSTLEGAARDKELLAESHMLNKERYYLLVEDLFRNLQSDESGKVTLEDFQDHFNDVEVRAFFHGLDLEPSDAWVLFSLLDDDGSGDIDAEEFVEGLLRLKGPARAIDLAAIGRDCKSCVRRVQQTGKQMKRLEGLLASLIRIYTGGQVADGAPGVVSLAPLLRKVTDSENL